MENASFENRCCEQKKTDANNPLAGSVCVGLLCNRPSTEGGVPFI